MNRRGFLAALATIPFVGKLLPDGHNCEFHDWRYSPDHDTWICHNCGFGDNDWAQHGKVKEFCHKLKPYRYVRRRRLPKVQWRRINKGVSPRED